MSERPSSFSRRTSAEGRWLLTIMGILLFVGLACGSRTGEQHAYVVYESDCSFYPSHFEADPPTRFIRQYFPDGEEADILTGKVCAVITIQDGVLLIMADQRQFVFWKQGRHHQSIPLDEPIAIMLKRSFRSGGLGGGSLYIAGWTKKEEPRGYGAPQEKQ